jgi:hypothetical protein
MRTWRAYLSATDSSGQPVHARDRIGRGPWVNANGELVASSLDVITASEPVASPSTAAPLTVVVNWRAAIQNK